MDTGLTIKRRSRASNGSLPGGRLAFLAEFFRNPRQIGSIVPSSRFLESRLVRMANVADAKLVVELGPGTGGTTRALLDAMPDDSQLLAVEICPALSSLLKRDADPRLTVHHGSAEDLPEYLQLYTLSSPDIILSGIPFSAMPRNQGVRTLEAVWSSLAVGGLFIAYQLRRRVVELAGDIFGAPTTDFELFNLPPVRLYCWEKRDG